MSWQRQKKLRQTAVAYFFLMPALLILLLFTFYPMVYGIVLSFYDYNMLRHNEAGDLAAPEWVKLDNFKRVFDDPYFFIALKNSFLYLLIVPVIQLFAILTAILVNQKIPGITWFRTAYYIPVITSIVIVGIAWKWVFASDGILNFFLVKKLHLAEEPIPWLTNRNIALFSVMFVTLWQGIGYYMLLYLAGLQSIPDEFEEAARLDGAGPLQVFWKITLPLLKPTIALCTIISCISALKVFGEIYVMTGGGPENGTLTMVYYIFTKAFMEFEMGYAAALALVLAVFVGIISFINVKFFQKGGLSYY
ncbi:MAG: carbohydrate ABC transporter permease [Vulcanimicrobiota bacterium]